MTIKNVSNKATEFICQSGGDTLRSCFQCGLCTGICPFYGNGVKDFSIRSIIGSAKLGITGYEDPQILNTCSTCGLCQHYCPRGVKQIDMVRSIRTVCAQTGFLNDLYRNVTYSVRTFSNPWGSELKNQFLFERNMGVPFYSDKCEYALFVCCSSGYEPRIQYTIKALSTLLKRGDVTFGALKGDLVCCGESVRKIGAEEEFQILVKKNSELWKQNGIKKIITLSPHCYFTLKNEYPEYGGDLEVYHYTEILAQILDQMPIRSQDTMTVGYHDPCYLGRHCELYDPPREMMQYLENVRFVEMNRSREESICCGGGGGKIWLNVSKEERLADLRIKDAGGKDMEILATACPYCIMMLEYSRDLAEGENEKKLRIMDLSELLLMCTQ